MHLRILKKLPKGKWSKNIIATTVSQLANSEAAAFCLFPPRLLSANAGTEARKPRGSALLRKQQKFTYPSFVIQKRFPPLSAFFLIGLLCRNHHHLHDTVRLSFTPSWSRMWASSPIQTSPERTGKKIYIHIWKKSAWGGMGGREKEAFGGEGGAGRASRLWGPLCNSPETHQQ